MVDVYGVLLCGNVFARPERSNRAPRSRQRRARQSRYGSSCRNRYAMLDRRDIAGLGFPLLGKRLIDVLELGEFKISVAQN